MELETPKIDECAVTKAPNPSPRGWGRSAELQKSARLASTSTLPPGLNCANPLLLLPSSSHQNELCLKLRPCIIII